MVWFRHAWLRRKEVIPAHAGGADRRTRTLTTLRCSRFSGPGDYQLSYIGVWRRTEVPTPSPLRPIGLASRSVPRTVHSASDTHLFGSRSPLVACLPASHYGLFGVALRRVTIPIGLFSVRLSEGSDPAGGRSRPSPLLPHDGRPRYPSPVHNGCLKPLV